jgi:hypothetical protein
MSPDVLSLSKSSLETFVGARAVELLFQVTLIPHPKKASANKALEVNAAEREGCCMQVGERVRLLTREWGGWQHLAVFD